MSTPKQSKNILSAEMNLWLIQRRMNREWSIAFVWNLIKVHILNTGFPQFCSLWITIWRVCVQVKHEGLGVTLLKHRHVGACAGFPCDRWGLCVAAAYRSASGSSFCLLRGPRLCLQSCVVFSSSSCLFVFFCFCCCCHCSFDPVLTFRLFIKKLKTKQGTIYFNLKDGVEASIDDAHAETNNYPNWQQMSPGQDQLSQRFSTRDTSSS